MESPWPTSMAVMVRLDIEGCIPLGGVGVKVGVAIAEAVTDAVRVTV
ncbi:MAG: hypothetical protein WCE81_06150 [Halobacteriota archaeon]